MLRCLYRARVADASLPAEKEAAIRRNEEIEAVAAVPVGPDRIAVCRGDAYRGKLAPAFPDEAEPGRAAFTAVEAKREPRWRHALEGTDEMIAIKVERRAVDAVEGAGREDERGPGAVDFLPHLPGGLTVGIKILDGEGEGGVDASVTGA